MFHIPICPFSQRVEILLALKGMEDALDYHVVDITVPRPAWLLEKTRGTTAMPILELEGGEVIKESLVIARYVEERFPTPAVAREDPYERAVENMLIAAAAELTAPGYALLMNQERARRAELRARLLARYAELSAFLERYARGRGPFLFERYGLAEVVYTPFFQRFYALEHYEGFELPDAPEYRRARDWVDACRAQPQAQQVTREQVIKLYYDYARGAGNGALAPGRARSSFAFAPDWRARPWPPREKYAGALSDAELGLV